MTIIGEVDNGYRAELRVDRLKLALVVGVLERGATLRLGFYGPKKALRAPFDATLDDAPIRVAEVKMEVASSASPALYAYALTATRSL